MRSGIISYFNRNFNILLPFEQVEKKSLDLFMFIRSRINKSQEKYNSVNKILPENVTSDILLIAIDDDSLNKISKNEFVKNEFKKFIDNISKSKNRESALFLDVDFSKFFNEKNYFYRRLASSIKYNRKVLTKYPVKYEKIKNDEEINEARNNIQLFKKRFDLLEDVSGTTDQAIKFYGMDFKSFPFYKSITDTGFDIKIEDVDNIIRKYPLAAKYPEFEKKSFIDLHPGDYSDVVRFVTYSLNYDKIKNEYSLVRKNNDLEIFDQTKISINDRNFYTKNDLDLMKAKIEKINNDLKLEIDILKGNINKKNRDLADKINKHNNKSDIPDEWKEEIFQALMNKDNLKDLDEMVLYMTNQFIELANKDKKYEKEAAFYSGLYKKCIKINKDPMLYLNIKGEIISLYDIIFNNKKFYFDEVILENDNYIPSIPLSLILKYYHSSINDVEVVFGKEIIIRDPMVIDKRTNKLVRVVKNNKEERLIKIPIDKNGFLRINYAGTGKNNFRFQNITFQIYSIYDFLQRKDITINNKIILLGGFSDKLDEKTYLTPFKSMYNVELMANVLNTIIMKDYIKKIPILIYILILIFILIFISFIFTMNKIPKGLLLYAGFLLLFYFTTFIVFIMTNYFIEFIPVFFITFLCITVIIILKLFVFKKQTTSK